MIATTIALPEAHDGVWKQILTESSFPTASEMLSGEYYGTIGLFRHYRTLALTSLFVIGAAAGDINAAVRSDGCPPTP